MAAQTRWLFLAVAALSAQQALSIGELAFGEEGVVSVDDLSHARICGFGKCCRFAARLKFGVKQKADHRDGGKLHTRKEGAGAKYLMEVCSQCGHKENQVYRLDFLKVDTKDKKIGQAWGEYPVFFRQEKRTGRVNAVWTSEKDPKSVQRGKKGVLKALAKKLHRPSLRTLDIQAGSESSYEFFDRDEFGESTHVKHTLRREQLGGFTLFEETSFLVESNHTLHKAMAKQHKHLHGHHHLKSMVKVKRKVKSVIHMKGSKVVKSKEKASVKIGSRRHLPLQRKPKLSAPEPGRNKFKVHYEVQRLPHETEVALCAHELDDDDDMFGHHDDEEEEDHGDEDLEVESKINDVLQGSVQEDLHSIMDPEEAKAEMQNEGGPSDAERVEQINAMLDEGNVDVSRVMPLLRDSIVEDIVKDTYDRYSHDELSLEDVKNVFGALSTIPGHKSARILASALADNDLPDELRQQAAVSLALRGGKGANLVHEAELLDAVADVATGSEYQNDPMRQAATMTLGALCHNHADSDKYITQLSDELSSLSTGSNHVADLLDDLAIGYVGKDDTNRAQTILLALANAGPAAAPAWLEARRFSDSAREPEAEAAREVLANVQMAAAPPAVSESTKQILQLKYKSYDCKVAEASTSDWYGVYATYEAPLATQVTGFTAKPLFSKSADNGKCAFESMRETCVWASCEERRDAAIAKCYCHRVKTRAIQSIPRSVVGGVTELLGKMSGKRNAKPGPLDAEPNKLDTISAMQQFKNAMDGAARKLKQLDSDYIWYTWTECRIKKYKEANPKVLKPYGSACTADLSSMDTNMSRMQAARDLLAAEMKRKIAAFETRWKQLHEKQAAKEAGAMNLYTCSNVDTIPWFFAPGDETLRRDSSRWDVTKCIGKKLAALPPSQKSPFEKLYKSTKRASLMLKWRQAVDHIYDCVSKTTKATKEKLVKEAHVSTLFSTEVGKALKWRVLEDWQDYYDEAVEVLHHADEYFIGILRAMCKMQAAQKDVTAWTTWISALVTKRDNEGPQWALTLTPALYGLQDEMNQIRALNLAKVEAKVNVPWEESTCKSNGLVTSVSYIGTIARGEGEFKGSAQKALWKRNKVTCTDPTKNVCGAKWLKAIRRYDLYSIVSKLKTRLAQINCELDKVNSKANEAKKRAELVKIESEWAAQVSALGDLDDEFGYLMRFQCGLQQAVDNMVYYSPALTKKKKEIEAAVAKKALSGKSDNGQGGSVGEEVKNDESVNCATLRESVTAPSGTSTSDEVILKDFLNFKHVNSGLARIRDTAHRNIGTIKDVVEKKFTSLAPVTNPVTAVKFSFPMKKFWLTRTKKGDFGVKVHAGMGKPPAAEWISGRDLTKWASIAKGGIKGLFKAATDAGGGTSAEGLNVLEGSTGVTAKLRNRHIGICGVRATVGWQSGGHDEHGYGFDFSVKIFGLHVFALKQSFKSSVIKGDTPCYGTAPVANVKTPKPGMKPPSINGARLPHAGYHWPGVSPSVGWTFPLGCYYGVFINVGVGASGKTGLRFIFALQPVCRGFSFDKYSRPKAGLKAGDSAANVGVDAYGQAELSVKCAADFWGLAELYVEGAIIPFKTHATAYATFVIEARRPLKMDITSQSLTLRLSIGIRPGSIGRAIAAMLPIGGNKLKNLKAEMSWHFSFPSNDWGLNLYEAPWFKRQIPHPEVVGAACTMKGGTGVTHYDKRNLKVICAPKGAKGVTGMGRDLQQLRALRNQVKGAVKQVDKLQKGKLGSTSKLAKRAVFKQAVKAVPDLKGKPMFFLDIGDEPLHPEEMDDVTLADDGVDFNLLEEDAALLGRVYNCPPKNSVVRAERGKVALQAEATEDIARIAKETEKDQTKVDEKAKKEDEEVDKTFQKYAMELAQHPDWGPKLIKEEKKKLTEGFQDFSKNVESWTDHKDAWMMEEAKEDVDGLVVTKVSTDEAIQAEDEAAGKEKAEVANKAKATEKRDEAVLAEDDAEKQKSLRNKEGREAEAAIEGGPDVRNAQRDATQSTDNTEERTRDTERDGASREEATVEGQQGRVRKTTRKETRETKDLEDTEAKQAAQAVRSASTRNRKTARSAERRQKKAESEAEAREKRLARREAHRQSKATQHATATTRRTTKRVGHQLDSLEAAESRTKARHTIRTDARREKKSVKRLLHEERRQRERREMTRARRQQTKDADHAKRVMQREQQDNAESERFARMRREQRRVEAKEESAENQRALKKSQRRFADKSGVERRRFERMQQRSSAHAAHARERRALHRVQRRTTKSLQQRKFMRTHMHRLTKSVRHSAVVQRRENRRVTASIQGTMRKGHAHRVTRRRARHARVMKRHAHHRHRVANAIKVVGRSIRRHFLQARKFGRRVAKRVGSTFRRIHTRAHAHRRALRMKRTMRRQSRRRQRIKRHAHRHHHHMRMRKRTRATLRRFQTRMRKRVRRARFSARKRARRRRRSVRRMVRRGRKSARRFQRRSGKIARRMGRTMRRGARRIARRKAQAFGRYGRQLRAQFNRK